MQIVWEKYFMLNTLEVKDGILTFIEEEDHIKKYACIDCKYRMSKARGIFVEILWLRKKIEVK